MPGHAPALICRMPQCYWNHHVTQETTASEQLNLDLAYIGKRWMRCDSIVIEPMDLGLRWAIVDTHCQLHYSSSGIALDGAVSMVATITQLTSERQGGD
jgi:hypothetical protein